MNIENDVHSEDGARSIRLGLAAELTLGLAASVLAGGIGAVLLIFHQHEYGVCFIGFAPWLPMLLAQDYWRWVGFMKARPQMALANDLVFGAVQVFVFIALYGDGMRSALLAVISWGVGATGGALYGLWQHHSSLSARGGFARIRQRWHFSKWLVASDVADTATAQSTLVLCGALIGPTGLGGLKAGMNLVSGPSKVFIQAASSVALPEASRRLARYGWPGLRRVQRWTTAAGMTTLVVVAAAVFLFGHRLLVFVYGTGFGRFATAADIVAVAYFVNSFAHGAILSLKTTRQTRRAVPVYGISLAVSTVAMVSLAPAFGIIGAAVANLIGNVTRTAGLLICHWTTSRRSAEASVPAPESALPAHSMWVWLDRHVRRAPAALHTNGTAHARGIPTIPHTAEPTNGTLAVPRPERVSE